MGTHALWQHNTSNRSFNFSHIVAATRTVIFDDALQDAKRHHIPHKVMEQCRTLRFGLIDEGKEAFARAEDLKTDSNDDDEGICGCFNFGKSGMH
jgi:hypothetical protein